MCFHRSASLCQRSAFWPWESHKYVTASAGSSMAGYTGSAHNTGTTGPLLWFERLKVRDLPIQIYSVEPDLCLSKHVSSAVLNGQLVIHGLCSTIPLMVGFVLTQWQKCVVGCWWVKTPMQLCMFNVIHKRAVAVLPTCSLPSTDHLQSGWRKLACVYVSFSGFKSAAENHENRG